MADQRRTPETRACATCGTEYSLNPKYSRAQKERSRFCSLRCSGLAIKPARIPLADLLGGRTRFGMLTFVGEGSDKGAMRRGIFRCDCGVEKPMGINKPLRGTVVSCGCESGRRSRSRFTKHGGHRTPEYKSWNGMMQRCHNPNDSAWENYGGRGIAVCPEWHGPEGYHRFVAYVGPRPKGMSIDRIDNDRGYEPGNVRWATSETQANNKRTTLRLTFEGETLSASDWAKRLGMSKNTITERLRRGWSVERALGVSAHD